MIRIPILEELREIRSRLSAQCQHDVARYAQMLEEVAVRFPGKYVTRPRLPPPGSTAELTTGKKSAG